MIRHCYIFICAVFLASFVTPNESFAQCIPGAPCIEPLTANDPQDSTDGPNYTGPNAPKSGRDSCSADFMNQMHARASIEANREIMIAGGVITRPDSVLEYTCFSDEVSRVGSTAGPIFSSLNWTPTTVLNPGAGPIQIQVSMGPKLTQTLQSLVLQSLNSHTGNFASNFLGGIPGGPSKGCGAMDNVYRFAKCENVNDTLHIMSFADIIGTDPRNIAPSAGTCTENPITAEMVALANNDDGVHAHKDDTLTYLEFVGRPPTGSSCADPIPTGLRVKQDTYNVSANGLVTLASTNEFEDKICSTPGCYFTGGSSGTCQR